MMHIESQRLKDTGDLLDIGKDGGEILHYDNPDFPVMCRRNVLCADETFPFMTIHWHDDIEFIHILEGSIRYRLNGRIVTMKSGEGIMVNTRQLHVIESDNSDCVLDCIIFHPLILCASKYIEDQYVDPVISNPSLPYLLLSDSVPWQKKVLEYIETATVLGMERGMELGILNALTSLWELIYKNTDSTQKVKVSQESGLATFRRLVEYINTNYKKKITLAEISRAGGVGRTSCNSLFLRYANSTPMDYLRTYRISKSIELLDTTDLTITEIAYEVGFSGASYFAECFKACTDCTPLEFKKIRKKWNE